MMWWLNRCGVVFNILWIILTCVYCSDVEMGEFTDRRMHLNTAARSIHVLSVNMGPFDIHRTKLFFQNPTIVANPPDIFLLTGIPESVSIINALARLGYREYFVSGNDWSIGITIAVKNGMNLYVDKVSRTDKNGFLLARVIFQETVLGFAFLCSDLGLGTNLYAEIESISRNSHLDALLLKIGDESLVMEGLGEEAGWRFIAKDLAIKETLKNITIGSITKNQRNQTVSFMLSASKERSFSAMDTEILPVKRPYSEPDDSSDSNGSLRPLKKPRKSIY